MPPKSCCSLPLWSEFPPGEKVDPASGWQLRAADPDSDQEHQHSSDNHLECGAEKRRIHVPVPDPANEQEFNCDNDNGNGRSSSKIWNQIWQGVTDSSCCGHQSA